MLLDSMRSALLGDDTAASSADPLSREVFVCVDGCRDLRLCGFCRLAGRCAREEHNCHAQPASSAAAAGSSASASAAAAAPHRVEPMRVGDFRKLVQPPGVMELPFAFIATLQCVLMRVVR